MRDNDFLIVQGLRKYYPVHMNFFGKPSAQVKAVDGVNLAVKKGETFGLVGESGCGKTTLGRCILRLEEPSEGKVFFENQDILAYNHRRLRRLRRDMQMIFQDPYSSLNPRKTVGQIVGDPFSIHGIFTRRNRREKVKELLEIVGIQPDQFDSYPHQFSGGQRQRIGVARALALNPKLVIADEPVSALDVSIQAQILNLLVRLQRQFDLTYILISHDLGVVRHISDRVAVMYFGRIMELGSSELLFDHPLHPYTEALISAIPIPARQRRHERIVLEGDVPGSVNPPSGCRFHPRCKYRQSVCKQHEPLMREVENEHWVACYFPKNT